MNLATDESLCVTNSSILSAGILWSLVVDISTTYLNVRYRVFRTPNTSSVHIFCSFHLRGGYGEFRILYSSQAYSTKLATKLVFYNLKFLKFSTQFMIYFLRYPGSKQKNIKVKKCPAYEFFWDWVKNWQRSSQAYHLKIGLPDFRNLI